MGVGVIPSAHGCANAANEVITTSTTQLRNLMDAFFIFEIYRMLTALRVFDEMECDLFKHIHARFSALNTARTDASSMFVSTPAPQRDFPSAVLIWM